MNNKYEIRKLTIDDLSYQPKCFQNNGEYVLCRHLNWGMFFADDGQPYYYMRNMETDKCRWGGIVKLGDGPLSPQTEGHVNDLAQGDTPTNAYKKISDDPITYYIGTNQPFMDMRYMEDHAEWNEANQFVVEAEYWPFALITHKESAMKGEYFHQFVTMNGTYEGKPIKGLGCFDRLFAPVGDFDNAVNDVSDYYASSFCSGICKDGRRECFYAYLNGGRDCGLGFFWREGEDPVYSEDVSLETEWYKLPYVPEGDTSCSYKNAVWRFAGKEFHIDCKWGSKGFTAQPRLDRVGYTHSFGPWYEGSIPYEHELYHNLNENMSCTVENLKKAGFIVHE